MAAAKKPARERKIEARDIEVGNRTFEAVMSDLAEVVKACTVRSARAEEVAAEAAKRSARAEEIVAEAAKRSARAEEVAAEAATRSARAEEIAVEALQHSRIALDTLGALLRDFQAFVGRAEDRLTTLENAAE
jgi:hypothetical protein